MNHKQIILVLLAVVVFTATVAAGVHILHKNAYAQVVYKVYVWSGDPPLPVTNANIQFRFLNGENWSDWQNPDSEENGLYKYTLAGWADDWEIQITNQFWCGVDPWIGFTGTPEANVSEVEWEVAGLERR